MTTNLNSTPLAALVNGAVTTVSSLQGTAGAPAALADKSLTKDPLETNFSNILQIHKDISLDEIEAVPEPVLNALVPVLQAPESVQPEIPAVDQESVPIASPEAIALPEAMTARIQVAVDTGGGILQPQGGNPLPLSEVRTTLAQPVSPEDGWIDLTKSAQLATASGQWVPSTTSETSALARLVQPPPVTGAVGAGLPALVQSPVSLAGTELAAQEIAGLQSVEPFAKWSKLSTSPIGSGNASMITQTIAEVATSVDDGPSAESIRLNTLSPASERQAAQTLVPVMPLARPAGSAGWDQGLGQRILWMVDNGLNQAELRLDPPHLGSVNIRIMMQDDQAQLMFQAAHPGAREALEAAMPKLREMFAQQGLELGDTDVSGDNNPSAGDDGQAGDQAESSSNSADSTLVRGVEESREEVLASSVGNDRRTEQGYVDEFV